MKIQGFVGPTYSMDAKTFDSQRCVNLYPLASETGTSKSQGALRSIPGYELSWTAGAGPVRGAITTGDGRAFVVSGNVFYEILETGPLSRGTISTPTQRVSMAENGNQILIADMSKGFIYDLSANTLTEITDADFPDNTQSVAYLDGYFIAQKPDTNDYYISALNDGLVWDTLDFSQAASNPDFLVGVFADVGNIWLFGTKSTEVHTNTGNADFPFERIDGAVMQVGCADSQTIQRCANAITWLGVDEQGRGVVWRASGYNVQRISTQAIESIISESGDFSGSYAYVYHEEGHVFYCLNVSGINTTLVFDASTNLWHERMYYDNLVNAESQHRASCHFFYKNKNYIGDSVTGSIYQQSLNLYDYNGVPIHRIRTFPHLQDEKKQVVYSNLEIDCETGVGGSTDPQIMLQYSNDGGRTWSNEVWKGMGKVGEYKTRVRWSRLGTARQRTFRVRYTENTFFQMNEAFINAN